MKKTIRFREKERKQIKIVLIACCLVVLTGLTWLTAQADDYNLTGEFPANRKKAQTIQVAEGNISLAVKKGTSTDSLSYEFNKVADQEFIPMNYQLPEDMMAESDLYSLTLSAGSSTDVFDIIKDFSPKLMVKYPANNKSHQLYIWDKQSQAFIPLTSTHDLKTRLLSYQVLDGGELLFGIFSKITNTGKASWYVHPRYPKDLMAASTAYPRGAQVKVTNLANNKSVVVTIKDWGPDPAVHPDRILDLGKVAFSKIASTREGMINVLVEPIVSSTPSVATSTATTTATSTLSIKNLIW